MILKYKPEQYICLRIEKGVDGFISEFSKTDSVRAISFSDELKLTFYLVLFDML